MKFKGELLVGVSAAGFSLMPVFAKSAYAGGASVGTVLLLRFYFALAFIWAYIFINRMEYKINLKQAGILAALGGIFYFGSSIALFSSYKFISAGLAEVLMFTYPAWVLVISYFAFKERLEKNKLFAIMLSICGVMLVSYSPNQKFNSTGIILALIGALSYAIYVAFIDHDHLKDIHPMVMTGYILIFVSIIFTIYGLIRGGISLDFTPISWIHIILLAFISTSVSILAFCLGVKIIGPTKAAIISTVEPIMTFIFGYIFLGEKITLTMALGAMLVIGAITFINVFKESETVLE